MPSFRLLMYDNIVRVSQDIGILGRITAGNLWSPTSCVLEADSLVESVPVAGLRHQMI